MIFSNERNRNAILNELGSEITSQINYIFDLDTNPNLDPLISLTNMGLCKGGICVNSTFSWFGGYLCEKTNKMLLADEFKILSRKSTPEIENNLQNSTKYKENNKNEFIIMPNKWFTTIPYENYKDIYPKWNSLVLLDT